MRRLFLFCWVGWWQLSEKKGHFCCLSLCSEAALDPDLDRWMCLLRHDLGIIPRPCYSLSLRALESHCPVPWGLMMGMSQLRSHLFCPASGWGWGFACRPLPVPALFARGIRKPSSHHVLNQQNAIQSKHICSDVTDKLWREYLSCLKKLLPPASSKVPWANSHISAGTHFNAELELMGWTVNGNIWGTSTPA